MKNNIVLDKLKKYYMELIIYSVMLVFILIIASLVIMTLYNDNNKLSIKENKLTKEEFVKWELENKIIADSIYKNNYRLDSLAIEQNKLEYIKTIKSTIKVKSCYLSSPNSCGGYDLTFNYINISNKTIKYLYVDVSFKNAVDDVVYCTVRNRESFGGKSTGPIKPGRIDESYWDCVIYNWSTEKFVMNSVTIYYMDGSSITIKGKDLKLIGFLDKQINL